MKTNILSIPRKAFAASLAAGLAAAGALLIGNVTQAQPTISGISLPDAVNNPTTVGSVQFQGAVPPSSNYLSFQVTSATGVTAVTVTLTAIPLPNVLVYSTAALGAGTTTVFSPGNGLDGTTNGSLSETITLALPGDTICKAAISVTDAGGTTSPSAVNFDTLNPNYFTWEAEDFDYNGGQFIDSLPAGTYNNPDGYLNLAATTNIDVSAGGTGSDTYRPEPEATEVNGDTPRNQFAGGYADYDVGYNNGGNWMNYTRHYPAGVYNIYVRGSDGNGLQVEAQQMEMVTAGYGTSNQTLSTVGNFSVNSGGWQVYHWSAATDSKGNTAAWAPAGDQETLRLTIENGNCNQNCFMLVPAIPVLTPNTPAILPGAVVAISIDPYALTTPTLQWQTDSGTGGTTWTSISGASANSISVTNTVTGAFEYRVLLTLSSNSTPISVTSAPVTVNMEAPTAPSVSSQIYPATPIAALTGTATTLSASFNGTTLSYQWLVSSNLGVSFTPVAGATSTALVVLNLSAFTNEYELQASNTLGVAQTTPVTLTSTLAPPPPLLQIAGDVIVELRESDLVAGAKAWTNRSGSAYSVGNFVPGGSTLTVSNSATPLWGAYSLNALYVSDAAQALTSQGESPNEINTNGDMTMELWIYPTVINGQSAIMGYGVGGGSTGPAEQRDFGYGTDGYGGFTADYGSSDQTWSQETVGWHYVVCTWDGTSLSTYQDGVFNKTTGGPLNTFQSLVTVGQASGAGNFDGFIASARLLSGVLTPIQVSNNFAAGLFAEVPITVYPPTSSSGSDIVTTGYTVTLTNSFTTTVPLSYTYQWLWDSGSGGATWTAIPGATNLSYVLNTTGLALGTYEYEVEFTNAVDSIEATSDPIFVSVVAATGPLVAADPGTNTVYVNQSSVFTASITGPTPLTLQWQVSSDDVQWASAGLGATNSSLTVIDEVPVTNYYRLQAINPYGSNYTTAGENIVLVAPPLQIAGDLIADLRESDLVAGAPVWTNATADAFSVGNFVTGSDAAITVSNGTVTPVWGALPINALYVSSVGQALTSTGLSPAEINVNGTMTMEAWVYPLVIPGQQAVWNYGVSGGSTAPAEQRDFGYGTDGYAGFTADYGNSDQTWSQETVGWHYLVCTWDGTSLVTYQDGVFNKSTGGPLNTVQSAVNLGEAGGGLNFDGFIASARLMSGVLTASQVSNNFNSGILGINPLSLGPPSLSPLSTDGDVTNAITQGQTATLGVVAVTNVQYPVTYQWYTDNATQGATWTAISGATGLTYVYNAPTVGAYEFEVTATNAADSIGAVSPPTTVNVVAPAPVTVVNDITPAGTTTTVVTVPTTFIVAFSGSPVVYYQWQQSANGTTWTSVAGANETNLTVYPQVAGTTYYRLQATNSVNTAYSSAAILIATAAPSLPGTTLATAGDLIVNLQAQDLVVGATVWTNQTDNANSVGNFSTLGGGNLNVLSSQALANDYHNVNVLNVADGAGAVQSALLAPSEILSNGPVSMEVWVYATGFGNQDAAIAYGIAGGSATYPQEERALEYGTANYGAFTADYGDADLGWSTAPTVGWHYLVATYDGTTVTLYQDGVTNATIATPGVLNTLQTYVEVGSQNNSPGNGPFILTGGGNPFDGYIGAARLESGVLTEAQVKNNLNAGLFATVSGSSVPPAPVLGATISDGKITLTWTAPAVLVESTSVSGPWTAVPGATSPFVVTPTPSVKAMFYAVSAP